MTHIMFILQVIHTKSVDISISFDGISSPNALLDWLGDWKTYFDWPNLPVLECIDFDALLLRSSAERFLQEIR